MLRRPTACARETRSATVRCGVGARASATELRRGRAATWPGRMRGRRDNRDHWVGRGGPCLGTSVEGGTALAHVNKRAGAGAGARHGRRSWLCREEARDECRREDVHKADANKGIGGKKRASLTASRTRRKLSVSTRVCMAGIAGCGMAAGGMAAGAGGGTMVGMGVVATEGALALSSAFLGGRGMATRGGESDGPASGGGGGFISGARGAPGAVCDGALARRGGVAWCWYGGPGRAWLSLGPVQAGARNVLFAPCPPGGGRTEVMVDFQRAPERGELGEVTGAFGAGGPLVGGAPNMYLRGGARNQHRPWASSSSRGGSVGGQRQQHTALLKARYQTVHIASIGTSVPPVPRWPRPAATGIYLTAPPGREKKARGTPPTPSGLRQALPRSPALPVVMHPTALWLSLALSVFSLLRRLCRASSRVDRTTRGTFDRSSGCLDTASVAWTCARVPARPESPLEGEGGNEARGLPGQNMERVFLASLTPLSHGAVRGGHAIVPAASARGCTFQHGAATAAPLQVILPVR